MLDFLNLPPREKKQSDKTRDIGINLIIDRGYNHDFFNNIISNFKDHIDIVKFGWGTSLVTPNLESKIEILKKNKVPFFFGGTLFEKAYVQKKVDKYFDFAKNSGASFVEISDGTADLPKDDRGQFIKDFSKDFKVLTEVGYKDTQRSQELYPKQWIELMNHDLDAGAFKVITESRESATSGICRANGEVRYGLIEEILDTIEASKIIFEAPNKQLQTYFIKKVGSNVNLGNIAFDDIIPLETLRLGLRSDTFLHFES